MELEKFVNDQVTRMLTEIAWYKATDSYNEKLYEVAIDSLVDFAMFGFRADAPGPIYDILVDVGADLRRVCKGRLYARFDEILPSQIERAKRYDDLIAENSNAE